MKKMMKKIMFGSILLGAAMLLTSCRVNWFGDTFDVPWYCVAIPVAVIFVISYFFLMSFTYVCPHCQTEFRAKPYQLFVTVHWNRARLAKCPKCGKLSFCRVKR